MTADRGHTDRGRKDQLLDAALAEFVENGYAAVGVKEITARAGVSHGTFYNYFDNRRQLLTVLVEREFADLLAVFDDAFADLHKPCTEEGLRTSMETATRELLELVQQRPEVLSFILIDVPGVDQEGLEGQIEIFREAGRRAGEFFRQAVVDGLADPELNLEFAGQAWVSYLLSITGPVLVDDQQVDDIPRTAEIIVDFLLHGSPKQVELLRD
ncbi:putative TetR family transcriptional regulator [Gordonia hirsuta DSM 44140 = NBRC 16056]|uniref:Putative TetR family transcriptional regulator n=1 Tax=Gordonia hirsuta DSM 44140 = NBRC 16056 TaxID=1121927 RepID=L7LBK5_9ACTN|nr:TetR/AcrR family transcriptional regulator [Gordonia hirsuta]GAC58121.1 putative TetR family transcriptional regulator [Gordonia hirsuta DSM 44140 = NBRC 16056]